MKKHPWLGVLTALLAGVLVSAGTGAAGDKDKKDEKKDEKANPAVTATPREPNWIKRHEAFVAIAKKGDIDLLFVGDSITEDWRKKAKTTWDRLFAPEKAANFGISGDRTENVLWRLQNGELDGITPKVVVLLIGTNNTYRDNAAQIAEGITAVVKTIREKSPATAVLLLGVFPRGEKTSDWQRAKIAEINKTIARLDDGKQVVYLDIGAKFLEKDGLLTKEVMPDFFRLSAKGYEIWGSAINPTVQAMLGKTE